MSYMRTHRPWWVVMLVATIASSGCGGCGCAGRNHPVFDAAAKGNVEEVAAALDEDPTLLEETSRTGWSTKGRMGSGPHNTGKTLAHIAAENGQLEVLKLVAERGADLQVKNTAESGHRTPIHYAAEKKHRAIVAFLLEKGVDVNAPTDYPGDAALHMAVRNLDVEMVELLLAKKADPNLTMKLDAKAPLHEAVTVSATHMQEEAIRAKNRAAIIQQLVAAGAEINKKSEKGTTALHLATDSNLRAKELVELLLKNGADINALDEKRHTPLHWGVHRKEIAELLLANKADVHAKNEKGLTPVEYLIERGMLMMPEREVIAEVLIKNGASRELWEKAKREFEKKNELPPPEKK